VCTVYSMNEVKIWIHSFEIQFFFFTKKSNLIYMSNNDSGIWQHLKVRFENQQLKKNHRFSFNNNNNNNYILFFSFFLLSHKSFTARQQKKKL
jgi:hypothetical protein